MLPIMFYDYQFIYHAEIISGAKVPPTTYALPNAQIPARPNARVTLNRYTLNKSACKAEYGDFCSGTSEVIPRGPPAKGEYFEPPPPSPSSSKNSIWGIPIIWQMNNNSTVRDPCSRRLSFFEIGIF